MSYEEKGSMVATVIVTRDPDRSGNYVCNGTNDHIEINAAINHADDLGGGIVHLGRGTYDIGSAVLMQSEVILEGEGRDTDLVLGSTYDDVIRAQNEDNITIRDLSINGSKASHAAENGERSGIQYNLVDNGFIERVYVRDVFGRGIRVLGSTNVDVEKCTVTGCDSVANHTGDGIQLGQEFTLTAVYSQYCRVRSNYCSGNTENGIDLWKTLDCEVSDNVVLSSGDWGILVENADVRFKINDNVCNDNGDCGIQIGDSAAVSDFECNNNTCNDNTDSGIKLYLATDGEVNDNIVRYNQNYGIHPISCSGLLIEGNQTTENGRGTVDRGGMYVLNCVDMEIALNRCDNNSYDGILVTEYLSTCEDIKVLGNYLSNNGRHGLHVQGVDRLTAEHNDLISNTNWGILLDNTCNDNKVLDNKYYNNGSGLLSDSGIDTVLTSKPFQFIKELNGTYETTSPTGILIDAATETAILQGHIPVDAQQIVRLRIFAVAKGAPIGAGGQMHAEFTFNAGAANAAYNTAAKSWNITDFDGEEADYVANDVVTWVIEDGDVGNELSALVASDKFELFAIYETGADPDGATNAVFGSISVEYV